MQLIRNRPLKLAICGPATCGKDAAAMMISRGTGLRFPESSSAHLVRMLSERDGIPAAEILANKNDYRERLYRLGVSLENEDPAWLARLCLDAGDVFAGCRSTRAIRATHAAELVDLSIWIDRDVPPDKTLEFGPEECDVVVSNRGTLRDLENRLRRLFRCMGYDWNETKEESA